ncbi:hypothetical protein [Clostridium formicaceticum]|uniref:Uncharacterized protein n=1 Tax=Clostridium formicaceticum TaxID=1497 RepID=A0AAC9RJI0_9CLOT|nr:hypothetical protein [Clostridium formicaceticum]AOY76779.1 hypothetical protein BJL90_13505 [Clostridium formicaceticum]ARE87236.1 hypothetical protein CLFO_16350 [Clostridium formicaceticum]
MVLEGNRRVSACQLLLSPHLTPPGYKIPSIKNKTKNSIQQIDVDIASSRMEAQSSLASKHIDGIKKWSTLSKQKFYANSFDGGKSIDFISDVTGTSKPKIKTGIIEYKLLNYAFNLNVWTEDELIEYLDLQKLKPTPFLRVFTTKSEFFQLTAKDLLKLSSDDITLAPTSDLPKPIFDEAIHLIAKGAFVDESFNTRNTIDDVPGVIDLLSPIYLANNQSSKIDTVEFDDFNANDNFDEKISNECKIAISSSNDNTITSNTTKFEDSSSNNNNAKKSEKHQNPNPSLPTKSVPFKGCNFFENLTWSQVDVQITENHGLILIAQEIVNISKNSAYKRYPISATILMRALLEQTMIYHLRYVSLYDKLLNGNNVSGQ